VQARYDTVADWYVNFTRDWSREPLALMPDDLTGQHVLDLAAGYGVQSRQLASYGAIVTGVELSAELLARAVAAETEHPQGITYIQADATNTEWWDGQQFDGVLCHMALMDIDDLDGALRTARRVLKPDGWFTFSVFHPCYPGGPGSTTGLPSWPPEAGYSSEGWWCTDGDGVRGKVGANHRMLSTYLNRAIAAQFSLEQFLEPPADVPLFLVVRCAPRPDREPAQDNV
jgi:2-polyprenyl-3-methyl-5-hydroxy-6-metoxy-1,4-benzoquinol methylase